MNLPIQLISTDFDGTLFAEFENPPVPAALQAFLGEFQVSGGKWVINTGRDLPGVLEVMARGHLTVKPDYIVTVEREIHVHDQSRYVPDVPWNEACTRAHAELFTKVRPDIPHIFAWITSKFQATVYADVFSPFCLIAENNGDADVIHEHLNKYCASVPDLVVVRNDVYARFGHRAYSKGTALAEIGRRLKIPVERTLAAGDHLNDIPMLSNKFARWLVAPGNAIPAVQKVVREQRGYLSKQWNGAGTFEGIQWCFQQSASEFNANK